MADFGDVVRHVILRILVDQGTLAADIAKAKAELKKLTDGEKTSNDARVKDAERVTDAYGKQREAIDKNREALTEHERATSKDADTAVQRLGEQTKATQADTKQHLAGIQQVRDAEDRQHQRNLDHFNAESRAARDLEKTRLDAANRASREQQRLYQELAAKQHEINDSEFLREFTEPNRLQSLVDEINAASQKLKASADSATADARNRGHLADEAGSNASMARTGALAAADTRSADAVDRRLRTLSAERKARQELNNLASQGNLIEQRALAAAEQRARSEVALAKAQENRQKGLTAFLSSAGRTTTGLAVVGGRAAVSAPGAARRAGEDVERQFQQRRGLQDFGQSSFKDLEKEVTLGEAIVGNFFHALGRDAEDGVLRVRKLKAEFSAFFGDLNRERGGSGLKLFSDLSENLVGLGQALNFNLSGLSRHFASMESVIVAVVAALGPLAALLGAVGAAALGLVSNLVALSGTLLALPGILTAVVSGFGVLALVLKPLTSLISTYSAAVKATAASATQAKDAALAYKQALLTQQQAEIAYHRLQQDGILLQRRVDDARKEAKRNVEDYQESLKKLAFDEEGAQLDVDSALQNYKRTLADPTATALDRREAEHSYQGALQDQYDTQKQGKRTKQDANEAISQGVEGNEQVISAERALQDQTYQVQLAFIAWKKAVLDTQKALATNNAKGNTQLADYQAQLKLLSPSTRKVAEAIIDLIKPGGAFQQMRNRLSEKIFGPIVSDTGKFKDILGDLEKLLSPVADALGQIAKQALAWLSSPDWKNFFEQTGKNSGTLLKTMADAAFRVADAIKNIVVAATPFTTWLVGAVAGVAKEFDNWTKGLSPDPKKNPIARFLTNTEDRIKEIWPILKDFAKGFAGFFDALNAPSKAGAKDDFTSKFNEGLAGMAKTFAKLGEDAAKPNSGFRKWLGEVGPLLKDVAHFLGQVGTFFGDLFKDPRNIQEAKDILKEIGTKWLPTLVDIFGQLASSGAISKLGTYIGDIFTAVDTFLKGGGLDSLKIVLDDVVRAGDILDGLVSAFAALPGVLKVVGATLAFVFGVALLNKLSGISAIIKGFSGLLASVFGVIADVRTAKPSTSTEPSKGASGKNKPGIASRIRDRAKTTFGRRNTGLLNTEDPGLSNLNTPTRPRGTAPRNTTEPQTGTRETGGAGLVNRNDTGEEPSTARQPSRFGRIVGTVKDNTKNSLTGASTMSAMVSRIVGFTELIEGHTRLIEINTQRRGGSTGTGGTRPSGGSGPSGAGGGGTRPTEPRPTGSGGAGNRPSYTGRATALPTRDSVRDQIDPYGNSTRAQRSTGSGRTYEYTSDRSEINRQRQDVGLAPISPTQSYRPGSLADPASRRNTTTAGYSPEREAENARRTKVKLQPLPPDVLTDSRSSAPSRNRDVGAADPNGYTVPTTPGGAVDKENRYRQLENSRRQRTGLPPLGADESTPRPGIPDRRTQTYFQKGFDDRVEAVVKNSAARQSGTGGVIPFTDDAAVAARQQRRNSPAGIAARKDAVETARQSRLDTGAGIVPRLDYQEPVEQEPTNPKARRKYRLARRNAQTAAQQAAFSDEPIVDRPGGVPSTDVGRDLRPYGLDEQYNDELGRNQNPPARHQMQAGRPQDPVTGRFVKQARDPVTNRFLPKPRPEVEPGPYESEPETPQPRVNGRFAEKPKPARTSRSKKLRSVVSDTETPEAEPTGARDRRRRTLQEGLNSPKPDFDEGVETGGVTEPAPSTKRKNRFRDILSSDEGSVGLGIGSREDSKPSGFATSKGSTYQVHDDGTTTRTKAYRPEHGDVEQGPQPRSQKTFYVTPEDANALSEIQTSGGGRRSLQTLGDTHAAVRYDDGPNAGKYERRTHVPITQEPTVGHIPVETFDDGKRHHFGNEITGVESRKAGRKGKGLLGGLLTGLGGLAGAGGVHVPSGEDPEYDDGYQAGYADASGGGSGGLSGPGEKDKKSRRKGRRASSLAGEAEEGLEDVVEGGRRGGKLRGLARGLTSGLGGAVAGAAVSGGAELGADYLIDKYVKSGKDKGSLTRAAGAVSQGASIGSTIGSFIPIPGGAVIGGALGAAAGGIYSLFKDKNLRDFVEKKLGNVGHLIADGFKAAVSGIGKFFGFLKDGWAEAFGIIGHFFADVGKSIGGFFVDLAKRAGKAAVTLVTLFLDFLKFWYITLPLTILKFFFVTLPGYAAKGIALLLKGFGQFLHFWFIDLPNKVEDFFIKHLPASLGKGIAFFKSIFFDPIANFFGNTIPNFFTKDIPDAISKIGPFLKNALIAPFQHFFELMKQHNFGYWLTHPGDFFSSLKSAFIDRKMSGGLIKGVYQGVEDTALSYLTPGEMVIRRSKTQEPGAKMFLQDFNERGMQALYGGLSASTKPPVMSMVAPDAQGLTGRVPTVVNNTVNHAPVMGDVTIHNPVREKAEYSLRRQVQLAAIRHRR